MLAAYETWASDYLEDIDQEKACLENMHNLKMELSGAHGLYPTEYEFKDVMCKDACSVYWARMQDLRRNKAATVSSWTLLRFTKTRIRPLH